MPSIQPASANHSEALDALKSVFGFDQFRRGQEPVVEKLLAGQSVLAIFPTGAGKSLCYQLPALMLPGVTLVISPLIALMKDQIDFLVGRGVAAARLDSTVTTDEFRRIIRELHSGALKLLYVAPERLANERFLETLRRLPLAMMAVDEAHCISEWGHNFRPDYLKIAGLARELKVGRVLALTATATPAVAGDVAAAFGIAAADVVQTGFYRPNLSLRITPGAGRERGALLLERLRSRPRGPTIVYVTLQRTAEDVARGLAAAGLPARAYHAGLKDEVRHQVQDWFMASDDAIVVATIAFGMGIDKSNIRYVYHYNLPKSLENYAQEIGRAGRDGEPSVCELLAGAEDVTVLENFTYGDTPTPQAVAALLAHVLDDARDDAFAVSTYDLSGEFDTRPIVIETLMTYLQLDGVLESTGPFYSQYQFQPLKPSAEILARFDPTRAAFLKQILSHARKASTWFHLDLGDVMADTGYPRERIVAAMTYLEEQGDLVLKVAGANHGYRRLRKDYDARALTKTMTHRFMTREARDVARLGLVTRFVDHEGCYARYLLDYFGEPRDADCGHCGWCRGDRPGPMPPARFNPPGEREAAAVRALKKENHPALAAPRQLARFLCGIASPGASRAKLTKHAAFGTWASVPFQQAMEFIEGIG